MDFNYFLKQKYKAHKNNAKLNYYQNKGYNYNSQSGDYGKFNPIAFINSLRNNRKLKIFVVVIMTVIMVLLIGLIALFYNLITLFVGSVSQNGVSGLLDQLINFLNTIWNGAN
jgi:hypothetical protein